MQAKVLLFAVLLCLLSITSVLVSSDDRKLYFTSSKPIADRLFGIAMAANCRGPVSKFPPSADSNKGPLGQPKPSLTTVVQPFSNMITVGQPMIKNGKTFRTTEYGPLGGLVVADASDGSITVAFMDQWDEVYLRLHTTNQKTKICDSVLCDKTCAKCATSKCHHCPVDHGFHAAWTATQHVVLSLVDQYTRAGFDGPIFFTGYALGGGIALEGGLRMCNLYQYRHRCAAVYSFNTPKVFDKDCEQAIANSTMSFFRVTWPDNYFALSGDGCQPASLDSAITTLWNSDKNTLKVCSSCLWKEYRAKFGSTCFKAGLNLGKVAVCWYCPPILPLVLILKAEHRYLDYRDEKRLERQREDQLRLDRECGGSYLPPAPTNHSDLESGLYQPLIDLPFTPNSARATGSRY